MSLRVLRKRTVLSVFTEHRILRESRVYGRVGIRAVSRVGGPYTKYVRKIDPATPSGRE